MNMVLKWVLVAMFSLACLVAAVSFVIALFELVRLPAYASREERPAGAPYNPLNVVFSKDKLSASGLAIRHKLGVSLVVFGISVLVGVIVGFAILLTK